MTRLEHAIIQETRVHLATLQNLLATPPEERVTECGCDLEFLNADARLSALLNLGHLPESGMSETGARALLDIESERALLLTPEQANDDASVP